jgi:hypothetical protein
VRSSWQGLPEGVNVVLVKLERKDTFYDPGTAYTPFGILPWPEMDQGELEGKVTVTFSGLEALSMRLELRNQDDTARTKYIEDVVGYEVMGYEVEQDLRPNVLQHEWLFQQRVPTVEARYTLQRPPGWEYKAWVNHAENRPSGLGRK